MIERGRIIENLDDLPERGIYVFTEPEATTQWPACKIFRAFHAQLLYIRYYRNEIDAIRDFNWDYLSGSPGTNDAWFAYDEAYAWSNRGLFDGRLRLISDENDGIAV